MIWNPNKILLDLGFFELRYYSLMWVVAFAIGWYIMKKIFLNENKKIEELDSLFIYTVLGTMLGARLGHVFFYDWPYFSNHLLEILLPIRENPNENLFGIIKGYEFSGFTGLASHGATIGVIVGIYLYVRKFRNYQMLWLLDRLVVPTAIGAFFVRLGNFFNSEINGKIISGDHPLAVKFLQDEIGAGEAMRITKQKTAAKAYDLIAHDPRFTKILNDIPFRHPAQMYEGIAYIFVFVILYFLYWKTDYKNKTGFLFGTFLVLLWTIRFFVEFVKREQGGIEETLGLLSTGQWLSIPFIGIGLYFMFRSSKTS